MAILHGISTSEIYPQPGFTVTFDDKSGYTARGTYAIRKEALDVPSVVAKLNTGVSLIELDDDPRKARWAFLTVSGGGVSYEVGDLVFFPLTFTGSPTNQYNFVDGTPPSIPRYSLDIQSGDTPLSQHPKWEALSDEFKRVLGFLMAGFYVYDLENNKVLLPTDDTTVASLQEEDVTLEGDAIEFAGLIQRGELTYQAPTITWTETTNGADSLGGAQLENVARIDNPHGPAPDIGGRNWMLQGGNEEQSGNLRETRLTWLLSGREKFSTFLYE